MDTKFALDITVARRRSGLSQTDVAYLMGISRSRLSRLESGKYIPLPSERAALSVIYGRIFSDFGNTTINEILSALSQQFATLPNRADYAAGTGTKSRTLNRLAETLETPSHTAYDG